MVALVFGFATLAVLVLVLTVASVVVASIRIALTHFKVRSILDGKRAGPDDWASINREFDQR